MKARLVSLLFAGTAFVAAWWGAHTWLPSLASRHGAGIDAMLNYLLDASFLIQKGAILDRYDARWDEGRDSGSFDRDLGSRGGSGERDRNREHDPNDVFTKDLKLPRGQERELVRDRERTYEINGAESPLTAKMVTDYVRRAARRAELVNAGIHILRRGLARSSRPVSRTS